MRLSRVYTPQALASGSRISLDEQRSHYLGRVLRLGPGARVQLFNGDGREYPAEITAVSKKAVELQLGAALEPDTESPLHTVLGLGISRGERMDYAIQKSTELGVSVIVPLFTEHCEVRLDGERQDKRLEHWRGVAISACEQCGRVRPPLIETPRSLAEWVSSAPAGLKLLFDHTQQSALPAERPQQGVALLIGPEGGLAPGEITKALDAGFRGIALGKRIFRTETAPVAALSVLQYLWG
jgi:16S rRNA (uracil1498-N3)-methyltransferase